MGLDSNNHSVFSLNYHLILVTKDRRKVINHVVSEKAKQMFADIGSKYHITIQEWNHEEDHIHVLFKAHPKTELSKFINAYKSASSRIIKKEFPHVKQRLYQKYFWTKSFCLLTSGEVSLEVIKNYIQSQGEGD